MPGGRATSVNRTCCNVIVRLRKPRAFGINLSTRYIMAQMLLICEVIRTSCVNIADVERTENIEKVMVSRKELILKITLLKDGEINQC